MAHIGDLIQKAGIYTNPGVVIEKKKDGTVTIDTDPMSINKYHRYINTTGLKETEKTLFNDILDEIYKETGDDVSRIEDIQTTIDKLKKDPDKKNVVQYLRNQQAVLIRKAQQLPRTYRWDEGSLPK